MQFTEINTEEKKILLDTARDSIVYGQKNHTPLPVSVKDYSPLLQTQAACFVTLNLHRQLRGCIGTLEAYQPLIKDVADHAYAAAFQDPRFSAVSENEIPQLEIHISILTPSEPMQFSSEANLLAQLQPGIDGLILDDGSHRATFLPSVWEQLSEPREFLIHLKRKAGWDADYWNNDIKASRYKTISLHNSLD